MTTDDEDGPPFELTDGTPEPGVDFEYDVETLLVAARIFLNEPPSDASRKELEIAIEVVSEWYEKDDPRSMGWVDDKGRP